MLDEIEADLVDGFAKAHDKLMRDLGKLRTGRANASLLEDVKVEYYGTPTPITQVATVKIPEARLITIQPWERDILGAIEKAIHASGIGLTPNNDGIMIRLPVPALTGERREELAKQARRIGEDGKIAVRAGRRDANDMVKALQKDGELSEDDARRALSKIQDLTDKAVARIDDSVAKKESEILAV